MVVSASRVLPVVLALLYYSHTSYFKYWLQFTGALDVYEKALPVFLLLRVSGPLSNLAGENGLVFFQGQKILGFSLLSDMMLLMIDKIGRMIQ